MLQSRDTLYRQQSRELTSLTFTPLGGLETDVTVALDPRDPSPAGSLSNLVKSCRKT